MKINKLNKNKLYSLILLCVMGLLNSCGEADLVEVDLNSIGGGFLQVTQEQGSISEGETDGTTINILFGGTENANGIEVKYTVTSDTPDRFEDPNNGVVSIPAGEFSTQILIKPIDNLSTDGDATVVVTINDDNAFPAGLLGGVNNRAKTITIIDDDCPISINDWVGTYSVDENFTSGANSPRGLNDFFGESYQLELALDPNDTSGTKLVITNSAGFNTYINNGTILSFDTCGNNVAFDGNNSVFIALFETFTFTESSYNEETFTIKCEGPYRGEYQFTLQKI